MRGSKRCFAGVLMVNKVVNVLAWPRLSFDLMLACISCPRTGCERPFSFQRPKQNQFVITLHTVRWR